MPARLIVIVESAANGLPDEPRVTLLILIEARLHLDDQIAKLDAVVMRLLRSAIRSA